MNLPLFHEIIVLCFQVGTETLDILPQFAEGLLITLLHRPGKWSRLRFKHLVYYFKVFLLIIRCPHTTLLPKKAFLPFLTLYPSLGYEVVQELLQKDEERITLRLILLHHKSPSDHKFSFLQIKYLQGFCCCCLPFLI